MFCTFKLVVKGGSGIESLTHLKNAIDYIEKHLLSEIDNAKVAKIAFSSKYHFQRMFHAITGFTINEYIRNRRLTLAAEALVSSNLKVIDIALKYQYESPEAFTKAFQRLHGITPSAARKMNVKLKSFPPLSFQIQIKGNVEMNYRIVDEKATIIVGKEVLIENDPYIEIPKFVEQIWVNGTVEQIGKLYELPKDELLFGYHFDIKEDGTRRYLMGTHLPDGKEVPGELNTLHLPNQIYAVFDASSMIPDGVEIGLEIHNVWKRIYSEWFPFSGFEQVEGVCIEKYYWSNHAKKEYICEVWIPVRKKE